MAEENKTHKGGKFDFKKYRWWIFGGGGILVLLFLAMRRQSSAGTSAQSTAQNNGIDPATGYLYGSPADISTLGGSSEGGFATDGGYGSTTTTNNYYGSGTGPSSGSGSGTGSGTGSGSGSTGTGSSSGGTAKPAGTPPATVHASSPSSQPKTPASTYYTVKSGDNLWNIAKKFYGSGTYDETIYNANRGIIGSNINLIHPGQRLIIPAK